MTHDRHTLYATALSIASSPGLLKIWDRIKDAPPEEAYASLEASAPPSTQETIAHRYPGSPVEAAKKIADACARREIRVVTLWDTDYPPLLREISKPPLVLYCRGTIPPRACISIVGTRDADGESRAIARRIARELAQAGLAITSGMAVGIDREAHLGALDEGGMTIGVLANGIDVIYPAQNCDVYREILRRGNCALVSEYPPQTRAGKWTFARRNRIISGISAATVIVQAGEKSGALITARYAVEQNRDVYVCAGPAYDGSYAGCHDLIRGGATLISSADDILDDIHPRPRIKRKAAIAERECAPTAPSYPPSPPPCEPGSLEEKILLIASKERLDVDSIARIASVPVAEVREAVSSLELSGAVRMEGNAVLVAQKL